MADSSETQWEARVGEQFVSQGVRYDLARAKELIKAKPRPVEMRPLSQFRPAYYAGVKIDWDKAEKTDPKIPSIVATEAGGKSVLIDGWHRYAKGLRTALMELPVVVLTEEETQQIRK